MPPEPSSAPLAPVARTAYYCCVLRADDAARPQPVCGDTLAARFVDPAIRLDLQPLLRFRGPSASNVARHRLIDDLLRERLAHDPARRVFVLGAGFDTRAFRLGGGRWWEFDDPPLLALKEARLPAAAAPQPLVRLPVDLRGDALAAHLAALAGDDAALVVLEGVSMYLSEAALAALARTMRTALPRATLVCDLLSPAFVRWFSHGLRQALARLGAPLARHAAHPRLAFEAAGYAARQQTSVVAWARAAGTLPIPRWLLATLLRELRDGYTVWVFEPADPAPPAAAGP